MSALRTLISSKHQTELAAPAALASYHPLAPTMLARCSLQRGTLAGPCTRQCSGRSLRAVVPQRRRSAAAPAASLQQREQRPQQQRQQQQQQAAPASLASLAALWALAADLPAAAADLDLSSGPPASSYYVSLGLFLITVPGAPPRTAAACTQHCRRRGQEAGGQDRCAAAAPAPIAWWCSLAAWLQVCGR